MSRFYIITNVTCFRVAELRLAVPMSTAAIPRPAQHASGSIASVAARLLADHAVGIYHDYPANQVRDEGANRGQPCRRRELLIQPDASAQKGPFIEYAPVRIMLRIARQERDADKGMNTPAAPRSASAQHASGVHCAIGVSCDNQNRCQTA